MKMAVQTAYMNMAVQHASKSLKHENVHTKKNHHFYDPMEIM